MEAQYQNLQSVAADNGFQDWHSEYEITAHDVEYLVHYRGSSTKAAANNALNRAKLCSAVDGRNLVLDNEALARRCRASAGLASAVP